jgi:hypothetical protein
MLEQYLKHATLAFFHILSNSFTVILLFNAM